jgi:hypothetical protein
MLPPSESVFHSALWSILTLWIVSLLSTSTSSAFAILLNNFFFAVFESFSIDSKSSWCTSVARCYGVNVGRMQCCGNKSKDPEVRYNFSLEHRNLSCDNDPMLDHNSMHPNLYYPKMCMYLVIHELPLLYQVVPMDEHSNHICVQKFDDMLI